MFFGRSVLSPITLCVQSRYFFLRIRFFPVPWPDRLDLGSSSEDVGVA